MPFSSTDKIFVAGHRGMVGSAIVRALLAQGLRPEQLLTRSHAELDLCNQAAVQALFAQERPTQVYLAAAKVGGIHANNTYPADFIYDNLMVQANVVHAAHLHGVHKLLFWAAVAFTHARHTSPWPKTPCSPARWSRPTSLTR